VVRFRLLTSKINGSPQRTLPLINKRTGPAVGFPVHRLVRGETMEWQPIETAPKDGTVIELLGSNGKLDVGYWYEWSEHFDKAANDIAEDETGEFSTEYGEGPHTNWRPKAPNVEFSGAPAQAVGKQENNNGG
jgi:hypothetical protein